MDDKGFTKGMPGNQLKMKQTGDSMFNKTKCKDKASKRKRRGTDNGTTFFSKRDTIVVKIYAANITSAKYRTETEQTRNVRKLGQSTIRKQLLVSSFLCSKYQINEK